MQLGEVTEPRIDQTGPPPTGEFTYVDISSIDNKTKRIVDPKRLPVDGAPSRARQKLQAGDVLVSMTRPNLNAVALVPPELDGAIGSTGFHVLRARDNVLPQWLYYGAQSRQFVGAMSDLVQGALYPAVRPKDIRAFDIPLPELDDQRRIVAELEKQFSRLDEAVANLKRVKANLNRYKAAVLKAAAEGYLLEHAQPTRMLPLSQLCGDDIFVDGDWVESKDQDPGGDIRLIQLADVGDGEYRDRSSRFLTNAKAQSLGCTFLEPGDLLIARMPDPLGRACIFPGDEKRCVTVVDVCILRPNEGRIDRRWLMHTMNSATVRSQVAALEAGSTRKRISRKNLATVLVPWLPRESLINPPKPAPWT